MINDFDNFLLQMIKISIKIIEYHIKQCTDLNKLYFNCLYYVSICSNKSIKYWYMQQY